MMPNPKFQLRLFLHFSKYQLNAETLQKNEKFSKVMLDYLRLNPK